MADPFYYVDGELDDMSPAERRAAVVASAKERRFNMIVKLAEEYPDEFVRALERESALEWLAEEEQTEAEDAARAERDT